MSETTELMREFIEHTRKSDEALLQLVQALFNRLLELEYRVGRLERKNEDH